MKILLIDDDKDFRTLFSEFLKEAGYTVICASDGKEGFKLFCKESADLVITDVLMPIMEGVETIAKLFKEFPDLSVIAISGGGLLDGQGYLESLKILPSVKHTFLKPFDSHEMLKVIKKLIG